MKSLREKIDGVNVIVETYKNFGEFNSVQDGREVKYTSRSVPCRKVTGDDDFRKCATYDEARDFLTYGYTENVEQMVKRINILQKTGTSVKTQRYADVTGFTPIVPNAIIGMPNSMMNQRKVKSKSKVITVVYDPSVAWYVETEKVLEYGCQVISYIMNLEKNGYRVRVEYLSSNADDTSKPKNQHILRIPLKSENNPVNLKRLSFALTHAAMQRYMVFDWLERLPKSKKMLHMGYSLGVCDKKPINVVKKILNNNEYLVYYGADLDEVFGQLKEAA